MLKLARATTPEALRGRLLALRERVRRKALALEAKYQKRRFPLDKARQEFQRNLDHLRSLQAEGRFPAPLLEQALLREMLRIEHVWPVWIPSSARRWLLFGLPRAIKPPYGQQGATWR